MWQLDHKEGLALKNMTLEKTPESLLDSKQIKPVNTEGNHPWIFVGMTNAEAEAPILWPPDAKRRFMGKDHLQALNSVSQQWDSQTTSVIMTWGVSNACDQWPTLWEISSQLLGCPGYQREAWPPLMLLLRGTKWDKQVSGSSVLKQEAKVPLPIPTR